ncbi:MAG: histidine kinase [Saprospiraceae bacterium]|nr:histidine kinase [Saprospiraceae bacterium]
MKRKTRQIILRTVGGFLFMLLPILSSPNHSMDIWANLSNPKGLSEVVTYALYLCFFFLHSDFIVPRYFFTKKYVFYSVALAICFAVISILPIKMAFEGENRPPHNHNTTAPPPPQYSEGFRPPPKPISTKPHDQDRSIGFIFSHYLPMFSVVLFVSLAMRLNGRWREVEQEKLNTEISYLRAQVNPHFLFNTLNSIYALSIEKSDETPNAVAQLSSMMRYVLNETQKDFVPLAKEITYISDYIDLQKLRFGNTLNLTYMVNGQPNGKQIAPLILITFIENAFKHGVNPEEESKISIRIDIIADELVLTVDNKKVGVIAGDPYLKSGLGIENARHRLQLLYPSKHELMIADEDTDYLICLKMTLT